MLYLAFQVNTVTRKRKDRRVPYFGPPGDRRYEVSNYVKRKGQLKGRLNAIQCLNWKETPEKEQSEGHAVGPRAAAYGMFEGH